MKKLMAKHFYKVAIITFLVATLTAFETNAATPIAEYRSKMMDQELTLIRNKISANPKKASAAQLSDESYVFPSEKETVTKWLQIYQDYASADLREVSTKYPYVLAARQKYHRTYEDLIVTLHSGKITFGEFNRKNRILQDAFDGQVALLNERRQQERSKHAQDKPPTQGASSSARNESGGQELGRVFDSEANAYVIYQQTACRIERYKNTYPLHFEAKLKDTGGIIGSGCYRVNNSDKEIISVGPNGKEVRFPIQHILSGASGGPGSEVNQGNSFLGNTLKFLQGAASEWNRIDQTDPFTRRRMQECSTNFGEQAWIDCVKGRGPTR